jgi:hypothetical protein
MTDETPDTAAKAGEIDPSRPQRRRKGGAMRTTKALTHCSFWLSYCLAIGWKKSDLDFLESLWWKYHDDYGNLRRKAGA